MTQIFRCRGETKNCRVKPGSVRWEIEGKFETGRQSEQQNGGKSGAETCDGVIDGERGRKRKENHRELLLVIHAKIPGNDIYTPASRWAFEVSNTIQTQFKHQFVFLSEAETNKSRQDTFFYFKILQKTSTGDRLIPAAGSPTKLANNGGS